MHRQRVAQACMDQGRLAESAALHEELLAMDRRIHGGKDHSSVAGSLCSLAQVYQAQGRLDESTPLHEEATLGHCSSVKQLRQRRVSHWGNCDITTYFGHNPHTAITPDGRLSSPSTSGANLALHLCGANLALHLLWTNQPNRQGKVRSCTRPITPRAARCCRCTASTLQLVLGRAMVTKSPCVSRRSCRWS